MDQDQIKKLIQEEVKNQLGSALFSARKVTDTPTDDLMVVNRKYVNMYGSIASAPVSSVIGQGYFATDLGYEVRKNSNYRWVNSVASVVG